MPDDRLCRLWPLGTAGHRDPFRHLRSSLQHIRRVRRSIRSTQRRSWCLNQHHSLHQPLYMHKGLA